MKALHLSLTTTALTALAADAPWHRGRATHTPSLTCIPLCAWPASVPSTFLPARTCTAANIYHPRTLDAADFTNCHHHPSPTTFACANQVTFVHGGKVYGFVAKEFGGEMEEECCTCYEVKFYGGVDGVEVEGGMEGLEVTVQVINAAPVGEGTFEFITQREAPAQGCEGFGRDEAGNANGGYATVADCAGIESQEDRDRCMYCLFWSETWLGDRLHDMLFKQVDCPTELMQRSGCGPVDADVDVVNEISDATAGPF